MAKRRPSGDGMVRKKEDGRWEGRIVVGHKQSGEPIFRYVYGRTQKELLSKLHQSIETYQDVELTEDSRITLGEWLDRWLDEYKTGTIRPSTMYGYRQYARLYIKPILGDKVISRITSTDIQRMYTKLKREGRIHEHPEYGYQLSDAMLSRIHAMLHHAMKDAVGAHLIAKNPTKRISSNFPLLQVSVSLTLFAQVTLVLFLLLQLVEQVALEWLLEELIF